MKSPSKLEREIKGLFFLGEDKIGSLPFIPSKQLTRKEVEKIAFDSTTPESIAVNFQRIIKMADEMKSGKDEVFCKLNGAIPEHRILYILEPKGLIIYID